jgi:hypothetical protein
MDEKYRGNSKDLKALRHNSIVLYSYLRDLQKASSLKDENGDSYIEISVKSFASTIGIKPGQTTTNMLEQLKEHNLVRIESRKGKGNQQSNRYYVNEF